MSFLEIRNVEKEFGPVKVLRGVNLSVDEHQVVCLIGASGCGKSTLLRCINGLEKIQGGEIRLMNDRVSGPGVDVNTLRRNVGIVFQSFNLFPHMTALENIIEAPIQVLGLPRDKAVARAEALLLAFLAGRAPDPAGQLKPAVAGLVEAAEPHKNVG